MFDKNIILQVWRILAAILLVMLGACSREPRAELGPQAGSTLAPLNVQRLSGESLSVQQTFRGKTVVLNVWATWCVPCRREMPGLQRLSETLDPRQFAVRGLSIDKDRLLATEFLAQMHVSFENFFDRNGDVAREFGLNVYPQTFLIGPDGVLIRRIVGEQDWDNPAMIQSLRQLSRQSNTPAGPDAGRFASKN